MSSAEITSDCIAPSLLDHVADYYDPSLAVVAAGSCAWIAGLAWAVHQFM